VEEGWELRQIDKGMDQIPGVYNSPFQKQPDPWELRLQKAKPLGHRLATNVKTKSSGSLSSWLACTSARSFPHSACLPPINRKQCQGPFRDISEVLQQRYKPLEPTLRVAEPTNHLQLAREALKQEERMRNVNDKMFLPFSSYHKKEKYVPMIHSSSKYNASSYGQKHFRSQDPKKWVSDKITTFNGTISCFPWFSKGKWMELENVILSETCIASAKEVGFHIASLPVVIELGDVGFRNWHLIPELLKAAGMSFSPEEDNEKSFQRSHPI
ncbi:hypothetical protein STEG23_023481, partial [Scotinomys teguina]